MIDIKEVSCLTASEVFQRLYKYLQKELHSVEDLSEKEVLFLNQHSHHIPLRLGHNHIPKKYFLVVTTDCIYTSFLLKCEGFLPITVPYYCKEGLFSLMSDDWGNVYLIKEERSYQFELII